MANAARSPESTVIIGGGIIGLSTAYYLSLHQPELATSSNIHIIDSAPTLFLSASGFAGGFLAKDWFSSASASLGALSFRLHKELANAHDGARRWGYAKSTAYSFSIDEYGMSSKQTTKALSKDEPWLESGISRAEVATLPDPSAGSKVQAYGEGAGNYEMLNSDGTPAWMTKQEGGTLEPITTDDSCAQVEPKELCEFLLSEVEKRGVKVHLNTTATGLIQDDSGTVTGLTLQANTNNSVSTNNDTDTASKTSVIPCENLILTAGAWTPTVFKTLFPNSKTRLPIKPLAGYSITVRSPRQIQPTPTSSSSSPTSPIAGSHQQCHSIFTTPTSSRSYAPELFSRNTRSGHSEIYIAGLNDESMPLPHDVMAVKGMYDEKKAEELRRAVEELIGTAGERLEEDDHDDKGKKDNIANDLQILRQSLCLRPVSRTGQPIISRISERDLRLGRGVQMRDGGVFVAAGHGPWGISLGLGTGLVVAEMVLGRKTSADLRRLSA